MKTSRKYSNKVKLLSYIQPHHFMKNMEDILEPGGKFSPATTITRPLIGRYRATLTCLSVVPPIRLHQSQGGGVGGGRSLGEVGVAKVSVAAAVSVAAVLDLRGCRCYQATVVMTLLLVTDANPATWETKRSNHR